MSKKQKLTRCKYCGARLKTDHIGQYCPTRNCQWEHGIVLPTYQKQQHTLGPWLNKGNMIYSEATGETIATYKYEEDGKLLAAALDLLEACELLQAALTEYNLRDVKKRYSLCVADAAASKAIAKAKGELKL